VLYGSQYPGGKIFNEAAFTAPPIGQEGDFGRNILRGFGAWQADLALQRQFHVTEKFGLRFRAEFFNILNHTNFLTPNEVVYTSATSGISPTAGVITATSTTSRQIQFGAKVQF
jgi:hypothetical protein